MRHKEVKVTLAISTYNRPEALRLCLLSALRQTRLPDEIIVGDDGSTSDTKQLIDEIRVSSPIPIIHIWQEDNGFRLARLRNLCIAASTGEYIVQIDGDLVLDRHFIADHLSVAKRGFYVKGGRVRLNNGATERMCAAGIPPRRIFTLAGVHHDRMRALRVPVLGRLFSRYYRTRGTGRGANTAFWKDDLLKVGGYDENFEGYGGEDNDIELRLQGVGVRTFKTYRLAIACHLWHKEGDGSRYKQTMKYIAEKLERGKLYATNGLKSDYPELRGVGL